MGVVVEVTIKGLDEINIDPAGLHVTLSGNLLFQVIQSDKSIADAFSIKMVRIVDIMPSVMFSPQTIQSTLQVDVIHTADTPAIVLETDSLKYDQKNNVEG